MKENPEITNITVEQTRQFLLGKTQVDDSTKNKKHGYCLKAWNWEVVG